MVDCKSEVFFEGVLCNAVLARVRGIHCTGPIVTGEKQAVLNACRDAAILIADDKY